MHIYIVIVKINERQMTWALKATSASKAIAKLMAIGPQELFDKEEIKLFVLPELGDEVKRLGQCQ